MTTVPIVRTFMGFEDHGIFTIRLDFHLGGLMYDSLLVIGDRAADCIPAILDTVGVPNWESVAGESVALQRNGDGRIVGFSHPYDKHRVFTPFKQKG